MIRTAFFVLLLTSTIVVFLLAPRNVLAQDPVSWAGTIDGVPTWITVVSSKHSIAVDTIERQPWWKWGNTTSDTYLFSFQEPSNVRLILAFSQVEDGRPMAKIYAAEPAGGPLEYAIHEGQLSVRSNSGNPFVTVTPRGGSWLLEEKANYNLDLLFDGLYSPDWGYKGAKTDGTVDVSVTVGGKTPNLPDWEVVQLQHDPNPKDAYSRLGATQRMADAPPFKVAPPVMPGFPYLGIGQQISDRFVENSNPLFFNLQKMELQAYPFVGFQTGGLYVLNSLTNAPKVDFEAPFGFYSFNPSSRQAQLVIRGLHFANGDQFRSVPTDLTSFRYSWKTNDDEKWRYSLQMAGTFPYTDTVRIGELEFFGIPPEQLPSWVSSQKWPVVSFVEATEGYPGFEERSEGIYYYSAQAEDTDAWLAGLQNEPPWYYNEPVLQQSSTDMAVVLPVGFRGEYNTASFNQPILYVDSMDNLVHLLGAQGGIWNLGGGALLRTNDLNGDGMLDVWAREIMSPGHDKNSLPQATPGQVTEAIYDIGSYLLHVGQMSVAILQSDHEQAIFTISPPTNTESWEAFRAQLAPYEIHRRDPTNLRSWLDAFPGPRSEIAGAVLANMRITTAGFRFELALEPGYRSAGPDLLGLADLTSGKYLVENRDGIFSISPLVPAQLSLVVRQSAESGAAAPAQFSIRNTGAADALGLSLFTEVVDSDGSANALARESVDVLAGETEQVLVNIPTVDGNNKSLRAWLEDSEGQVLAELVPVPLNSAPDVSHGAIFGIGQAPILLPVAGLFGTFLALAAVLAISRRRGQAI